MLCERCIELLLILAVLEIPSHVFEASIITIHQPKEPPNQDPFIIRLSGLFEIYERQHNGGKETCDKSKILSSSVQLHEMVSFTIDQINGDPTILPGVKIVLDANANCNVDTIALAHIVNDILPRHVTAAEESRNDTYWGIIGPETTEVAIPTAKLFGLFQLPQISYSATASALSEKSRFPYFFRTVSSDVYQVKAIVKLLILNGWEYVSFLYENNNYGNTAFDAFNTEIENTSICLAIGVKIKRNPDEADLMDNLNTLHNEHRAKVVIAFVQEVNLRPMLELMYKHHLLEGFQLIGSDTWTYLDNNFSLYTNDTNVTTAISNILDGTIAFNGYVPDDEYTDSFEKHIRKKTLKETHTSNRFFDEYLAFVEGCMLENSTNICRDNLTLPNDVMLTSVLTSASTSVRMFAHALEEARQTLCDSTEHITKCNAFTTMSGSQLKTFLQNVSFSYKNSEPFMVDYQQDGPAWYNIWRYNKSDFNGWQNIGYFQDNIIIIDDNLPGHPEQGKGNITSTCSDECSETQHMSVSETKKCCWTCDECKINSIVTWNYSTENTSHRNVSNCSECGEFEYALSAECHHIPHMYLSFEQPLGWCVAAGSCLGLMLTLFTAIIYVHAWDTPLIKASGRELSVFILAGLILVFSVTFLFCFEPTVWLCTLRRVCTGMCFTLVYAGVLVKTVRISYIFNNVGKKLISSYKRFLEPGPQVIIAASLTSVELFVIGIWFVKVQPEVTMETNTTINEARDQFTVVFIDCKGLKSHDLLIGLSYPILLLLICTVYAIKIRKVPAGFNEAKHIGFVVYTTLVIWLAQLSTYFVLTSSDIVFRDAVYCFGLCLNGLIIILALFGPKIYIILLRPGKNSQKMVMGSTGAKNCSTISRLESNLKHGQDSLNSIEGLKKIRNNYLKMSKGSPLRDEIKFCPQCGLALSSIDINKASIQRRNSLPGVFSTSLGERRNIFNLLEGDLRNRRPAKNVLLQKPPELKRKSSNMKKTNLRTFDDCLHNHNALLPTTFVFEQESKKDDIALNCQ